MSITNKSELASILGACVLLSLLTVYLQQQHLGLPYLETIQLERHNAVLENTAPTPWQYRVLSEYLVETVVISFQWAGAPRPVVGAFLSFRVVQNFVIFLLAALYYRKVGLHAYATVLGLALLAWAMSHSLQGSDLQFSTYFDVAFYLAAAWLLLLERDWWIVPLTLVAALNRETCGLIPFMLLAKHVRLTPRMQVSGRAGFIFALACAAYAVVFVGLRFAYGLGKPLSGPVGMDLLRSVFFFSPAAWAQFFATLSLLPLLTLVSLRFCPHRFRAIFWAIVPAWFAIIPFTGGLYESRHYLVPQALVFIPGTLLGLTLWRAAGDEK